MFVNSGPVLEESVHTTAVEQFKAGSPSGQGDWAVMKIPQERSEGNSALLFVMGKRRRRGQEGREGAMSAEGKESEETTHCACLREHVCVCARVRVCVCVSASAQVVKQSLPVSTKTENVGNER